MPTPNATLLLQQRITQLEAKLRAANIPGLSDKLAAFSEGSCTNDCTYGCTGGCTGGSCTQAELGEEQVQPGGVAQR